MNKLLSSILCFLIRIYQICISPFFPPSCRFYPSCSTYALTAIKTHGAGKGAILAFKRIIRCNPYCKGGYDPVPSIKPQSLGEKNG